MITMQENSRFPLFIDIQNQNVLIVGGGKIATRRVQTLMQFNCNIKVVTQTASEHLKELEKYGKIEIIYKNFEDTDLENIYLVTATTNVRFVNQTIGELARKNGMYVSVADSKEESNFYFPAIAKYDKAVIAIGSNGENHELVSNLAKIVRAENEKIDTTKKTLEGVKILITSPNKSKSAIVPKLEQLGAVIDHFATIDIVEIEFELPNLNEYTWIVFTSSAGVNIFFNKHLMEGIDSRKFANNKFAVVGSQTAKTLQSYGILADFIPKKFDGKSLMTELVEEINQEDKEHKFLLIRPQTNPEALREILEENKIAYSELSIYKTEHIKNEMISKIDEFQEYDYVTFTSSSCVESFNKETTKFKINKAVCIGEKTANTAKKYEMQTITSKIATIDSMIETIEEDVNSIKA